MFPYLIFGGRGLKKLVDDFEFRVLPHVLVVSANVLFTLFSSKAALLYVLPVAIATVGAWTVEP